nr:actin patches distal protein 1 [Quercus suber]
MSPAGKMLSILRSATEKLNINGANNVTADGTVPRSDGFSTAKAIGALFTQTNPDTDGEECLHDCATCTVKYPRKFAIDEEDKLYGEIKGWSRHLLVATGKTDWVRDVEDEKGSVMEAVGKHRDDVQGGKLMLSATNIPAPDHDGEEEGPYGKDRPTRVLLLPTFQWIDNVTPTTVPDLIKSVINTAPTNTSPLVNEAISSASLPASLELRACPHKYLVLLCSQATRDARCGQSAPLLRKELERHLRPLGLYRDLHDERPGGVGIYFISHVGGHKYSANMIVYRRANVSRSVVEQMDTAVPMTHENGQEGDSTLLVGGKAKDTLQGEAAQCIWLARVKPEDCENIIRYTVLQGKVVKPDSQLRGGFDREKGVVSW